MADEKDTKQIVHLALVPICAVVKVADARHGRCLVCVCLHPQAGVVTDAEHVVDDFKTLVLGGIVHRGDVDDLGVLGSRVVFQKVENREDARRGNVDCQLVFPDGEPGAVRGGQSLELASILLDVFGHTRHQILAVFVHCFAGRRIFVGRVHDRGLERARGGLAGRILCGGQYSNTARHEMNFVLACWACPGSRPRCLWPAARWW